MNLAQAVNFGIEQLSTSSDGANAGSEKLDAQLLLCSVIGQSPTYLLTWPEKVMDEQHSEAYKQLIQRRKLGEPVAYLTGERGFWSLDLKTDSCTLIPRPDTESLVEYAIELGLGDKAKILDLGTGTGAIALAIASEQPLWDIHACDLNAEAVKLAQFNAQKNALDSSRVTIIQSDWFAAFEADHLASFDLIVTNPPYVDKDDNHLKQGDLRFEPMSALVAADNGFADIVHIVSQAGRFLTPGGSLMVEHGFAQGEQVRTIFQQQGFSGILTKTDLAENDRFTVGCW